MAVLTADEARALGRSLATVCRSRVERVPVKRPPAQHREQYVEYEVQTRTQRAVVDTGPQAWTFAILVGGGLAGLLLWALVGAFFGVLLIGVACVAFAAAFVTCRKREEREQVIEEQVPVTKERTVLVPVPDAIEERRVAASVCVRAIGRVDLDFLAIPVGSGTVLVDPEGRFPTTRLTVRMPRAPEAVEAEVESLRALTAEVPAVLSGEAAPFPLRQATSFGESIRLTGSERQMWEGFDRLERALGDERQEMFDLDIVPPGHPLLRFLTRQAASPPVIPGGVAAARGLLEALARARRLEASLRAAAIDLPARHAALAGARLVALRRKVGPMCHNLGQVFHYSAFHFYCRDCNAEIQKDLLARDYSVQGGTQSVPVTYSRATLLRYDPSVPCWRCPQCEGCFSLEATIPIHRMLDEVFLPVYDRLMEENKTERLRIYSDTRNRELDYRNQLERDMDTLVQGTRTSLELVSDEVRRLEAEIAGEREALAAFTAIMVSHASAEAKALAQIEQSAREIEARVHDGAAEKLRDMSAFFNQERAVVAAEMDRLSRSKRLDDQSRDAIQRQIAASAMDIAQSSRVTASNTGRIAETSERIAGNTARTAVAAERTADEAAAMREEQKQSNAIMGAMANKMGVSSGPSGWNLIGQGEHALADLTSSVLLESDTERTRRKQEIPR
jgi:hypothetical protein